MSKAPLKVEVQDRPLVINELVSSVRSAGLNITDITYTILDTDSGKAQCSVYVEDSKDNTREILEDIAKAIASTSTSHIFDRWFRLPSVRVTLVANDAIGLVAEIVSSLQGPLGRNGDQAKGNILELKGFRVTDKGLFAVSMHVATIDTKVQGELVKAFLEYCRKPTVLGYDVAFDNFISEHLQEATSNVG